MDVDSIQEMTPEKKRRYENNLCLRCGKPGHYAKTCRNPFLKKEGKKPENKKPEVSAKIGEIPDSDEEPMVGAITAQDF